MQEPLKGYARLAEAIGEDTALALCNARGGAAIYIPATGTGRLGALLTDDQVDRLRDVFGAGLAVTIPMGPYAAREVMRRRGLDLLAAGCSVSNIANEIGVCPTTIRRWKRRSSRQA